LIFTPPFLDKLYQINGRRAIKNKPKEVKDMKVTVEVDVSNIDEYLKKANKFVELLKEAKTLADDLALTNFQIEINECRD